MITRQGNQRRLLLGLTHISPRLPVFGLDDLAAFFEESDALNGREVGKKHDGRFNTSMNRLVVQKRFAQQLIEARAPLLGNRIDQALAARTLALSDEQLERFTAAR